MSLKWDCTNNGRQGEYLRKPVIISTILFRIQKLHTFPLTLWVLTGPFWSEWLTYDAYVCLCVWQAVRYHWVCVKAKAHSHTQLNMKDSPHNRPSHQIIQTASVRTRCFSPKRKRNAIKHHLALSLCHRPSTHFNLSALHLLTQQRLRALTSAHNKFTQKGLAILITLRLPFHFAGHHAANTNRFRLQGGSCTSERIWPETL